MYDRMTIEELLNAPEGEHFQFKEAKNQENRLKKKTIMQIYPLKTKSLIKKMKMLKSWKSEKN